MANRSVCSSELNNINKNCDIIKKFKCYIKKVQNDRKIVYIHLIFVFISAIVIWNKNEDIMIIVARAQYQLDIIRNNIGKTFFFSERSSSFEA